MFLDESNNDSREKAFVSSLYKSFRDVVILDENLRTKYPAFKDLLLRIRNGVCTDNDYQLLRTRFASQSHVSSEEIQSFDVIIALFYFATEK